MLTLNKKKVLILCAHRPGRSPSQRYRFEQYLRFLEESGFEFTFSYLLTEKEDKVFYSSGKTMLKALILFRGILRRWADCLRFGNYHIVFIQREATFFGTSFFEKKAYSSGARVIFDFDDAIWLADTSPGNKRWEWLKKPGKLYDNLRYSHLVIAGNDFLAEKARRYNSNTVVIPTTIDTGFHVPKPRLRGKTPLVIGWSGSISTIKHFQGLRGILLRIKSRHGEKVKIKVIADKEYKDPELEPEVVIWSSATEVDELNSFDIGIMPLPDDEWAGGKCGLKGLSYMACGVATIMSAIGVNSQIIAHGENGLLVSTEEQWLAALNGLIEDRELREKLGRNGRKTVEERYSVIANRKKYLEAFEASAPNR